VQGAISRDKGEAKLSPMASYQPAHYPAGVPDWCLCPGPRAGSSSWFSTG